MGLIADTDAAQLVLNWTDNANNETGFRIERTTGGASYATLASTAANVTTYTDTSAAAATSYTYRVFAFNAMGDSPASNIAAVTLPATPTANTAPTISTPSSQSIIAGTTTGALAFTIADTETAATSLTLASNSSNPTLVPVNAIVFGGSAGNRTVTVTPAAGQSGSATITISVSDGTLTRSTEFVLTVTAVNTAPTITSLAAQTIAQNSTTSALAFTVGDGQTAPGSLTVTRNSSHPTLVPVSGIVLGGSGANRTVTITPASGQSGTATITITVSDGSLSTSGAFLLTVTTPAPTNTAPTISTPGNQTIVVGASTGALGFSINDAETAPGSLTVTRGSSNTTLVPVSAIALGGSGANRTVTINPATGQSGSATITLSVSDGTLSTSATMVLTVAAVAPANTAPTISAPGDQTIAAGAATSALAFSINDAETAPGSLTVTRSSSSPTLVPLSAIVLGGSGANRTVRVTPAPGQSGTATITLNVNDGDLSGSAFFTLTVNAPNTPPTVSAISGQAITQDGTTTALAFTVGDAETNASGLTVTATSSNPALVPAGNITITGTGVNRTITILPVGSQTGTSTITVLVSDGISTSTTSFPVTVAAMAATPEARMLNLSTRVVCRPGEEMLIPGFVITGDTNREVLLRAVGPTLGGEPFNVPGTMANPRLVLKRWSGTAYEDVASNDDWSTNANAAAIQQMSAQVFAFPLAPNSRDAALLMDLAPGRYTLFIDDVGQSAGVVIVELYDAETTITGTGLVNISNRGHVGVGAEVMISGFVVASEGPKTMLIRAVGPSLAGAPFNVANTLADPVIDLYRREADGTDTLVLTHDNWSEGSDPIRVAQVAEAVSAFPLAADSKDAAVVATLDPGAYTVVVRGADGATGTALVELYEAE